MLLKIMIEVLEGEDLMPVGQRMNLDPFVVLYLETNKAMKVETTCQRDTLKPVWNASFQYRMKITLHSPCVRIH